MPPSEPPVATGDEPAADRILRFTRAERLVHWSFAALAFGCLLTALALYVGPIATLVGRRALLRSVHLTCGYLLLVPLLLGLWSRAYRADLRRLDRFGPDDGRWLRSKFARRSHQLAVGKFNAGQKVAAAFILGSTLVFLATGMAMANLGGIWSLTVRTGSTFVHQWLALSFGIVIVGHLRLALRDRHAMSAAINGWVPLSWASHEHPAWVVDEPVGSARDQAGRARY